MTENPSRCTESALLANGDVFVTGGFNDTGYLDSSEIFRPRSGLWRLVHPDPVPRGASVVVTLNDGNIWFVQNVKRFLSPLSPCVSTTSSASKASSAQELTRTFLLGRDSGSLFLGSRQISPPDTLLTRFLHSCAFSPKERVGKLVTLTQR